MNVRIFKTAMPSPLKGPLWWYAFRAFVAELHYLAANAQFDRILEEHRRMRRQVMLATEIQTRARERWLQALNTLTAKRLEP